MQGSTDLHHPTFSTEEMHRRRGALERTMQEAGCDALLVYAADRSGSGVQWLTQWPATREAAVVFSPGDRDTMFVQFFNHVPAARRMASEADVRWGGPSTIASAADELSRRGAKRIGVIGPLRWQGANRLTGSGFELVDMGRAYVELRLVKSAEELDWMRRGAALSDLAIEAVREAAAPGVTHAELAARCEEAYLSQGATNHIHYFAITSMTESDRCVPSQWPTERPIRAGDIITCEISAAWWGYAGQVLRSITVGAEPTTLYRHLHSTADAAYAAMIAVARDGAHPRDLVEAASVIEHEGLTIYDDLVHGYGGGYFPPVFGSKSRPNEPVPDLPLRAGMTIVIQPNVITADERAGVQTGGLVAITDDGVEELQRAPRGLWRAG